MSVEPTPKMQALLWWLTSLAVSVLCCSVLFVLFASYFVDVKASIKENSYRINTIEVRENDILAEMEMLHKHMSVPAVPPTPGAPSADTSAPTDTTAPASVQVPSLATPTTP